MTVLSASGWLFLAAERRLFRNQEWQRYHDFASKVSSIKGSGCFVVASHVTSKLGALVYALV